MKLLLKSILLLMIIIIFSSCKDILSTEPRYDKKIITENLSPADSLKLLTLPDVDLGIIRVKAMISRNIIIANNSDLHDIEIYSIDNDNKTGIFTYGFPEGMPFVIKSSSSTELFPAIEVTFIADPIVPGIFYDTLYINQNEEMFIPIRVQTRF
ncbi:MAG: hypothetical protein KIT33_01740 [Candidatus Kapabacteria bacterium]|nr:hypothetical protein [Ignavibacteriota bacterium]MCW5883673.1 hypothetical protein [Candidatus Kapabacteria bacterium]